MEHRSSAVLLTTWVEVYVEKEIVVVHCGRYNNNNKCIIVCVTM